MKILGVNDYITDDEVQLAATIGMFDGMHRGHATLINALKENALQRGLHTAVVTFTHHPQHLLNPDNYPLLLMPLERKIKMIASTGIEYLILLDFDDNLSHLTSRQFMALLSKQYHVGTLVMGYNHRFGHDRGISFHEHVLAGRELGVEVVKAPEYLGEYAPVSSSIVRQLIAGGRVEDAMNCMGHPFELTGKVVHGFHNGRGIGFPTANVGELPPDIIIPHNGAYAVMVGINDEWHKGMVNIGYRPTLDNGSKLSIEVNIFNFDSDIYGKSITLQFVRFLRLEFKMVSIEQLREQLTHDKQLSIKILDKFIANQHIMNYGNHQSL